VLCRVACSTGIYPLANKTLRHGGSANTNASVAERKAHPKEGVKIFPNSMTYLPLTFGKVEARQRNRDTAQAIHMILEWMKLDKVHMSSRIFINRDRLSGEGNEKAQQGP
jgi:hypothetical protein